MKYEEKKKRLSVLDKIPEVAKIDHRHLLGRDGKNVLFSNLSRSERRKVAVESRKLGNKYNDIVRKIQNSGAGFPVDKLLRELAVEYTKRYANSGVYNQPLNFNYFESFCCVRLLRDSVAPYAEPITEIDHLFNITDYFDYLTSGKAENFDLISLIDLPEDKALHFSTNGDVLDFSYLNSTGREFVISGFSMVRRGTSLHWYLLGGEIYSDEEWMVLSKDEADVDLSNATPHKRAFLADLLKASDYRSGSPIALEGTKTAVRTVIAGEIDLKTKKYFGRCLMSEFKNCFRLICDDPEVFDSISNIEKREEMIKQMKKQAEEVSVLWDLAGAMFQLPAYFSYRVAIKKDLVVAAGKLVKSAKLTGGKGIGGRYKKISSIEIVDSVVPVVRQVIPPHYQVEVDGHWRRLSGGAIGSGPDGSKEIGRTWVKRSSRWRENAKLPRTIYVKSTVQSAELKLSEYEKAASLATQKIDLISSKNSVGFGELYVLRCTAMKDEIYKVGWTSGSSVERAEQISSETGVPMAFVVVESWKHYDARALEQSVHAMLDPYRLNERREFFHASFSVIKKIIEAEITRSG